MCGRSSLTIIVVAILALAGAQVQAEPIEIELNGDFKMYKPGTNYTVRARSDAGNFWVIGIGDNQTVLNDVVVNYDDGTTGTTIDCPGWISPITLPLWRDGADFATAPTQLFQLSEVLDGTSALNCFGAWSSQNGNLAESSESLGLVLAGATYTLSARCNGSARPLTFELRAGGVAMTPSSSVDPERNAGGTIIGGWADISRTYNAAATGPHVGQPITIVVGTTPPHTTAEDDPDRLEGARGKFDNITLSYELGFQATTLIPADEATNVCRNIVLSWIPGMNADKHDVYFGVDEAKVTDANRANPLGVLIEQNHDVASYAIADLVDLDFGQTYFWRIDEALRSSPSVIPLTTWLRRPPAIRKVRGLKIPSMAPAWAKMTATRRKALICGSVPTMGRSRHG